MSIVRRGNSPAPPAPQAQPTSTSSVLFDQLPAKLEYAKVLAEADLVPEAFRRKPGNILIALDMAQDLEISPMAALNGINVIQGKPSPSPELMRALLHRAGHRLRVVENSAEACEVQLTRADDPEHTHVERFTIEDAQRAGIAGGATWGKYPARMLLARATGNAVKTHAPDVLLGMTVVLDGDEQPYSPDGPVVDVSTGEVVTEPPEPRIRKIPVEGPDEKSEPQEATQEPEDEGRPFTDDEVVEAEVVDPPEAEPGITVDRKTLIDEVRKAYKGCDRNVANDFKEWRYNQGFPARADRMSDDQLIASMEWFERRSA